MRRDRRGELERGSEVVEAALRDGGKRRAVEGRRAGEDLAEDDGGQPVGLDRVGGRQEVEPVGDDRGKAVLVARAPGDERLQRGGGAVAIDRASQPGAEQADLPAGHQHHMPWTRIGEDEARPGRGDVRGHERPGDRARVGDLGFGIGQRSSLQQLADEHRLAAELHVGCRDHEPVDPAQRAPQLALGGGLVLEVELVQRGLADLAQDGARIYRAEDLAQRGGEHVEQGKVIANRTGEPWSQDLDRDLRAVAHAPVDLRAGRHHEGSRSSSSRSLPCGLPHAFFRSFSTSLNAIGVAAAARARSNSAGRPRNAAGTASAVTQWRRTPERDATARRAPDERTARLQQ